MNFDGWFHNPDKPGEGINVREYDDVVLATVYSYHADGSQLWLICRGETGDTVTLQAWEPVGGYPGDGRGRSENEWGTVTLSRDGDAVRVDFSGKDGVWGYRAGPVYTPGAETTVKLEKWHVSRWLDLDVPMVSRATFPTEWRLTVVNGPLTITRTYAEGPHNPRINGVVAGDVLTTGTVRKIRISADPGWKQVGGNYVRCHLGVDTAELGPLISVNVDVEPE